MDKVKAPENVRMYGLVMNRLTAYKQNNELSRERAVALLSELVRPIAHLLWVEKNEQMSEANLPYDAVVTEIANKLADEIMGGVRESKIKEELDVSQVKVGDTVVFGKNPHEGDPLKLEGMTGKIVSKVNESDKNPLYFIMRAVNRIKSGDKDGASWVFANEMDDQDRYKFDNNGVRPKNSTPSPQPYNYLLFYFKERVNNVLNIYN